MRAPPTRHPVAAAAAFDAGNASASRRGRDGVRVRAQRGGGQRTAARAHDTPRSLERGRRRGRCARDRRRAAAARRFCTTERVAWRATASRRARDRRCVLLPPRCARSARALTISSPRRGRS